MSAIPQNVLANQKATLDNLLAVQSTFFNGFEKLVDLNLKATKAAFEGVAAKSQEAIDLKDAQEAFAFASALVRPEQAMSYSKDVYDILSGVQGDLNKLAEAQLNTTHQQAADAIEQFSRNAPTGSESAVALMKSSLATTTNAYESVAKAVRQATDAAESNIEAVTKVTLKAAADATQAGKAPRAKRASAN